MLVVGLTGGISTGKSTVSNLFKSEGIPVIDADLLARQVVEPGTPGLHKIVSTFGPDILLEDGTLNRKKLGSIIFNDPDKRKMLNGIVHPAVRWSMFWGIVKCWLEGEKLCIMDVPLLIESHLWRYVGLTVVVYCSPEDQLQRLMKRDNSTREDAASRLNSQLPISEKVQYADCVIDNSGSLEDLSEQVKAFIQKTKSSIAWTWRLKWIFPPYGLWAALWTLVWRSVLPTHSRKAKRKAT